MCTRKRIGGVDSDIDTLTTHLTTPTTEHQVTSNNIHAVEIYPGYSTYYHRKPTYGMCAISSAHHTYHWTHPIYKLFSTQYHLTSFQYRPLQQTYVHHAVSPPTPFTKALWPRHVFIRTPLGTHPPTPSIEPWARDTHSHNNAMEKHSPPGSRERSRGQLMSGIIITARCLQRR